MIHLFKSIMWISDPFVKGVMRADAKRNYSQVLAVAREVVSEHGVNASMRDIARRSGVGLATLLRHFPTREALYEALLCTKLDALTQNARELEKSDRPEEALVAWLREWVEFAKGYRGVVTLMASAHANPDSALYASCAAIHSASARLLRRAQKAGSARADMNGDDLFALMTALGWVVDQPSFAPRADQLFHIIASAILTGQTSGVLPEKHPSRKRQSGRDEKAIRSAPEG